MELWHHGPRGGCEKVQRGMLTTGQGHHGGQWGNQKDFGIYSQVVGVVGRSSLCKVRRRVCESAWVALLPRPVVASPGTRGRGALQGTCEQLKSMTGFPRGLGYLRKDSFQTHGAGAFSFPCIHQFQVICSQSLSQQTGIGLGAGWAFIPQGLNFPIGF